MKTFLRNEEGNMGVLAAIVLVPIMGAMAIAVDHNIIVSHYADMQQAADSAALASALAAKGARGDVATTTFHKNLPTSTDAKSVFSEDGTSVTVIGNDTINLVFSGLIGKKTVDVKVVSQAAINNAGPDSACILVLDPNRSRAMMVSSDSDFEIDCGLQVNSSSREGVTVRSRGVLTATNVNVVGQSDVASGGSMSVTATHNAAPIEDPFASLPAPPEATGSCDYPNNMNIDEDDGPHVFAPGIYCGQLYFHRGADITFLPGVHVFRHQIDARGDTTIDATDVMMYFEGDSAYLNLHNHAKLDLSAPKTGDYQGIAIFQDRTAESRRFNFHSDSISNIEGAIYIPNGGLNVHSRAHLQQTAKNTKIIVKTMDVDSNAHLEVINDETSDIILSSSLGFTVDEELRIIR